jgi:hypothetical protein
VTSEGDPVPRLVYLSGVALLVVALAFLATDRLIYPPGLTRENVARIRPGMTLEQVNAILGGEGWAFLVVDHGDGQWGWCALWIWNSPRLHRLGLDGCEHGARVGRQVLSAVKNSPGPRPVARRPDPGASSELGQNAVSAQPGGFSPDGYE